MGTVRKFLSPLVPQFLYRLIVETIAAKTLNAVNRGTVTDSGRKYFFDPEKTIEVLDKERSKRITINEREAFKCVLKHTFFAMLLYTCNADGNNVMSEVLGDEDQIQQVNSVASEFMRSVCENLPCFDNNLDLRDSIGISAAVVSDMIPGADRALKQITTVFHAVGIIGNFFRKLQ